MAQLNVICIVKVMRPVEGIVLWKRQGYMGKRVEILGPGQTEGLLGDLGFSGQFAVQNDISALFIQVGHQAEAKGKVRLVEKRLQTRINATQLVNHLFCPVEEPAFSVHAPTHWWIVGYVLQIADFISQLNLLGRITDMRGMFNLQLQYFLHQSPPFVTSISFRHSLDW